MGPNLWTRNSPYAAKKPCLGNNNRVIGVVSRRPTNLGDMILKRKRFALKAESPWPKRCYPLFNNIRAKKKDIPIIVIKKCSTIITEHICGFMNNFIEIGIFPDILKRGCITPIFKKGIQDFLIIIDQCQHCLYLVRFMKN